MEVLVDLRKDAAGSYRVINWELNVVSEKQDTIFKKHNIETTIKPTIHNVTGNQTVFVVQGHEKRLSLISFFSNPEGLTFMTSNFPLNPTMRRSLFNVLKTKCICLM